MFGFGGDTGGAAALPGAEVAAEFYPSLARSSRRSSTTVNSAFVEPSFAATPQPDLQYKPSLGLGGAEGTVTDL